ncbi:MAG: LPS assembly protein LptD [Bryobacteraceae bacterium]
MSFNLSAQIFQPALPAPPQTTQVSPNPNQKIRVPRPDAPAKEDVYVESVSQEVEGSIRHMRGAVRIETTDMQLKADEVDYDEDTGEAQARGHVHFEHFVRGEVVDCDKADYNLDDETGTFWNISGTAQAQVQARPGLLTTTTPYYFHGKWAERLKDHYILHDGFLTDCIIPRPWWVLKAPVFDIIPGDHAIARRSWFYLAKIPLFYTPYFYKSLKKEPRRSGILIPDFGNNSLHGKFVGYGYYWAISRSFDLTYRGQYFSQAGLANHVELRGKLSEKTGFDLSVFGIHDNQTTTPSDSGVRINLTAKSDLGNGWQARADVDYLSSFNFLQSFTQSFYEAVFSESHSVGVVTRHWDDYGLSFVVDRNVNFLSVTPGDAVEIRKLPEVDFSEREHEYYLGILPMWVSFDSSAGFLDRSEPDYQTRQFVDRLDVAPHVTTVFRWDNFELVPTFGIRETEYGASFVNGQANGASILRSSQDLTVDLILPALARVFTAPKWLGDKVKHVIEPRVQYKYVTGVDDFERIIRFDENDLVTDTNQVEFSLTNRLLAKDKNGTVTDFLTWELKYARYFDPTFGGAVVAGQRNVIDSSVDLTGFTFLDGPRHSSPVVSVLRVQSKVGFEWRMDYDPLLHRISNSSITVDGRIHQLFWSVGNTLVREDPVLAPNANQFRTRIGYGNPNRRGLNYGFDVYYDYKNGMLQWWQTQATYNTDCCGFSIQYRRINSGTRDFSQMEAAFAVSNIGTFGTLKKQERMF